LWGIQSQCRLHQTKKHTHSVVTRAASACCATAQLAQAGVGKKVSAREGGRERETERERQRERDRERETERALLGIFHYGKFILCEYASAAGVPLELWSSVESVQ